mgnify:CR=1 FL=1
MKTKQIHLYTIDEHPDKEVVFDWIRNNWHDLGDSDMDDFIESLKALADEVGGKLDYSVSLFPDRGEFIRITDFNATAMERVLRDKNDLPLTGTWSDDVVINGLINGDLEYQVLKAIHAEGEYIYSDEGLEDLCEANGYYFTEDGTFHE